MAFITTETIPKSIPKHKRARLINLQRQKIMRQLKNLHFVWECQTLEYVTPFNSKMEQGVMTPAFVEQINKIEIPWLVMGYILSRESNGKNKLTPIEIRITTPCKHCEISGFVADTIMSEVEDFLAKNMATHSLLLAGLPHTSTLSKQKNTHIKCLTLLELGNFQVTERSYKMIRKIYNWQIKHDNDIHLALLVVLFGFLVIMKG